MPLVKILEKKSKGRMIGSAAAIIVAIVISFAFIPDESKFISIIITTVSFSVFFLFNYVEWRKYNGVRKEMEIFEKENNKFFHLYLPKHPNPLQISSHSIIALVNGAEPFRGLDINGYFVYVPVTPIHEDDRTRYESSFTINNKTAILYNRHYQYTAGKVTLINIYSPDTLVDAFLLDFLLSS